MDYPDLTYYQNDDTTEISKHLKQLNLYKFYEEIDKQFENKNDLIHCQKCSEKLKGISNPKSKLLELCKGVCNFIINNGNIKIFCNGSSCNSSCTRLIFRIYDHVMEINESQGNIQKFYEALQSISQKPESKLRDCRIVNFNLSKNEFICTNSSDCKYYNELTELRNEFITRSEITNVYDKCNYEKTPCKEGTEISTDIPCLTDKGNGSTVPILENAPNDIISILFKVLIYLVPILATFTILYKFTPLGSLIRSRMNKRKNMLELVYENNYDHLGNISKDEIPNSDSRDYNVLYQSDKNI
ncbi:Plasmodium vivax Vir protein, putative [Plasmodium vivax]|nr:Plasmodium vivax Vir protein, putative [Plasmodium vivax]